MKKLIAILAAALMLTACAGSWEQANDQQADGFRKAAVSEAYADWSAVLEKSYDKFTLPKEISVPEVTEVFQLECNNPKGALSEDAVKEIYRNFYGASFDEKNISRDEHGGIVYTAGSSRSAYWGRDTSLVAEDPAVPESSAPARYSCFSDRDRMLSFGGRSITVSEAASEISAGLSKMLSPLYPDLNIGIEELEQLDENNIRFAGSLSLDGVPFQYLSSAFMKIDNDGNMDYWMFTSLNGVYSREGFTLVNADAPPALRERKKQESIISLKEAVRILDSELAEYLKYEFLDIKLMYCCLTHQQQIDRSDPKTAEQADRLAEEESLRPRSFEPMWCFEIKPSGEDTAKRYVKVNAVTGDVFMDIDVR